MMRTDVSTDPRGDGRPGDTTPLPSPQLGPTLPVRQSSCTRVSLGVLASPSPKCLGSRDRLQQQGDQGGHVKGRPREKRPRMHAPVDYTTALQLDLADRALAVEPRRLPQDVVAVRPLAAPVKHEALGVGLAIVVVALFDLELVEKGTCGRRRGECGEAQLRSRSARRSSCPPPPPPSPARLRPWQQD